VSIKTTNRTSAAAMMTADTFTQRGIPALG
jgi:hypothetical protein